ncbi:MAG: RidA family protein [Candidatus Rokubacteria bacterium]|nr:RidA family protein [Candidatus Rokubacteria bacterium]
MAQRLAIVHHPDRRTDVMMPYAPAILVRGGQLVFLSGVTAAPVYHSHPHREEEFDLPGSMREQAVLVMENLRKTLEAAGCTLFDLVSATRYLTDATEQDDLNRVWAEYLGGHLPTTTTVEVSRLATHPRCKLEISGVAVRGERRRGASRASKSEIVPGEAVRRASRASKSEIERGERRRARSRGRKR